MTTYNYITDTGTITYDTTTLLTDVQNEWKTALGINLDVAASTPQGALITSETIARTAVMKNNSEVANMLNPNLAYGTFLDAICALMGITRGINTSTYGSGIQIDGNAGTVIGSGFRVQTANGDIFQIVAGVTIPTSGTTTADIAAQASGNVPLPVGNLTIMDGVIGWGDAIVTSSTVVTPGTLAMGDAQLQVFRNKTLANQGIGSSAAVRAAALNVANVTSVMVVENNTGTAGTVNGITFTLPNAIWVCVAGNPVQADFAQALYNVHNGGCPWGYGAAGMGNPVGSPNGIPATDPATGLIYNVKWTTPILFDAYVNITVHQQMSMSDPSTAVANAIMNYVNGLETNEPGLIIGASVSAFEMAGAVARQLPGMYVKTCSVGVVPKGSVAPAYPGSYVPEWVAQNYQQAVLQIGNITVSVV